jgi:methylenetetrahydrofolate dehydrogenase (NADP+)/methenyltetrahydrofolate cyclohydrolase
MCHSRTKNLKAVAASADILVVAIGRPKFIGSEYIKEGAIVIDVGTNQTDAGLVGDVDFDGVVSKAYAITPVPGGVGPLTVCMLMRNTIESFKLHNV